MVALAQLAAQDRDALAGVVGGGAEALRAEAIREAARDQLREIRSQAPRELAGLIEPGQRGLEPVAGHVADAQLVAVWDRAQHPQPVVRHRQRGLGIDAREAQPLARRRRAILHPGVPDVARGHTQPARQRPHRVQRGQVALLDPQVQVFPAARGLVGGDLLDQERLGRGLEARR